MLSLDSCSRGTNTGQSVLSLVGLLRVFNHKKTNFSQGVQRQRTCEDSSVGTTDYSWKQTHLKSVCSELAMRICKFICQQPHVKRQLEAIQHEHIVCYCQPSQINATRQLSVVRLKNTHRQGPFYLNSHCEEPDLISIRKSMAHLQHHEKAEGISNQTQSDNYRCIIIINGLAALEEEVTLRQERDVDGGRGVAPVRDVVLEQGRVRSSHDLHARRRCVPLLQTGTWITDCLHCCQSEHLDLTRDARFSLLFL